MALDANAYKRASATSDNVVPELYDEQAQKATYEAETFRKMSGVVIDKSNMLLNRPGKSFNVYKDTRFAVAELSEGTSTPVTTLDFDYVTLTVKWYGDGKEWSKETLSEDFRFVIDDTRFGAAGALGENRDNVIMAEWLNTTTDAIYPRNDAGVSYTEDTITSAALFQASQVADARAKIRVASHGARELRYVIVHPYQEADIMKSEQFIDRTKYGSEVLQKGLLGGIYGYPVISHSSVQVTEEGVDTSSLVDVYNAVAVGDRSILFAQKVAPVMKFFDQDEFARKIGFHYYEAIGVKNYNDDAIYILKSTSSL